MNDAKWVVVSGFYSADIHVCKYLAKQIVRTFSNIPRPPDESDAEENEKDAACEFSWPAADKPRCCVCGVRRKAMPRLAATRPSVSKKSKIMFEVGDTRSLKPDARSVAYGPICKGVCQMHLLRCIRDVMREKCPLWQCKLVYKGNRKEFKQVVGK